jgi:hypothetical protein
MKRDLSRKFFYFPIKRAALRPGFRGFKGKVDGSLAPKVVAHFVVGLCSLRSRGDGPSGRGLWYRPGAAKRPEFRRFKRFRGFRGEGIAFGDEYEVSVT